MRRIAVSLAIGLALIAGCASAPEAPSLIDEIAAELEDAHGMQIEQTGPSEWRGTDPDGVELIVSDDPLPQAMLTVPADDLDGVLPLVVRYNVAMARLTGAPPGLAIGWVEDVLDPIPIGEPLHASMVNGNHAASVTMIGNPRRVQVFIGPAG